MRFILGGYAWGSTLERSNSGVKFLDVKSEVTLLSPEETRKKQQVKRGRDAESYV